ncbi:UNVERIFIED_CONTAM: L-type lectin-domain containing receptor kinase IV.1 [Sesamum latifolium]|uniref:non-specific serine/threonine protein kinase n=1 Tax=Sesamum latifolium TaxID=2727402 RepID=A0AAW2XD09_9LAMI
MVPAASSDFLVEDQKYTHKYTLLRCSLEERGLTKKTKTFSSSDVSVQAGSFAFVPQIAFAASDSSSSSSSSSSFTFSGFKSANLSLDGLARIMPNGLLRLSNATKQQTGHAFYPSPFTFKTDSNSSAFSFSTYFVFAIVPEFQPLGVELDTLKSSEFNDINDNHVGIDITGLESVLAKPTAYYDKKTGSFQNLTLNSGRRMQVWIEYDGPSQLFNVTLAPLDDGKPSIPLLSLRRDLSPIINQIMYVGFSAAPLLSSHYVLGWSFSINGVAQPLDLSQLPKLPRVGPKKQPKTLTVGLPVISIASLLLALFCVAYYARRKWKYAEVLEGWELDYVAHRFRYKDLYIATKGFKEKELLGSGGFGKVYRGVMPGSKIEIAVKRVSHESRQGVKEFVAEIVSIGRLRHRNLVPLLGYCRRKGELLLVYEYMPNGSLDKFLHDQPKFTLNWDQRFRVIKGVASGLLYLHEEWEQVVIHRDIKASNVLLDGELRARLGDFGLARLTGKATTSTDVYGFGAFLLEVACGRRPVEPKASNEKAVLVEWVFSLWSKGEILGAVDPNLGNDYAAEEAELVLKLGLLCSHSRPEVRPRTRDIVRYLEGEVALPELSSLDLSAAGLAFAFNEGFDDFAKYFPSSTQTMFTGSSSIASSLISTGR